MRVTLDACVLYPTVLRQILIGCAARKLYRPLWSARILEEWARATVKLGRGGERVARAEIAALRADWPGSEVDARRRDLDGLSLPDPNDVHVLAAAIAGGADAICTFNAQDFPRGTLAAEGLVRLDPDQLLSHLDPGIVEEVVRRVHATAEEISGDRIPLRSLLKRAKLPKLGKRLST